VARREQKGGGTSSQKSDWGAQKKKEGIAKNEGTKGRPTVASELALHQNKKKKKKVRLGRSRGRGGKQEGELLSINQFVRKYYTYLPKSYCCKKTYRGKLTTTQKIYIPGSSGG